MAVAHKGAISFGLVHIPVSLYTSSDDTGISFNQLHKKCMKRIRYKKTCPACGINEVASQDIVKAYEYEKDKYVVMEEDEFEKIKTEKDKTIYILHFSSLTEIDPIYYEKTYYVAPDGSDRAYALLKNAMESEHKVAIAKTVMGTKEKLLTIRAAKEGLLIETMYFQQELKAIPKPLGNTSVDNNELNMAKMLINNMTKSFKPEVYRDEYTDRLKEAIMQKINGSQITESKAEGAGSIANLMDALQQSVLATQNNRQQVQ